MTKTKQKIKVETFTSPESSNVEGGSYNPETHEALIAFRDKKDPEARRVYYRYSDIAPEDWAALMAAPSKGKYVREIIRNRYVGKRVN